MKKQQTTNLSSLSSSLRPYLLSRGKSMTTVGIIERSVYAFSNWCDDERITPERASYQEILAYIKYLQQRGLKQRTVQMLLKHLDHYYEWLVNREIRQDKPTQGIQVRGVQRKFLYHIVAMKALEAVYEKIQGNSNFESGTYKLWEKQSHYSSKQHKVLFGLMIWQGLDSGEITRLRLADVKLREGKIYISGTRRSNERTLKLESIQLFDMLDYLQHVRPYYAQTNPNEKELFFITSMPGARTDNRMHGLMKRVSSIDSQLSSPKQIRASVITHWLKLYNLREVQYMAGHRYVSSTESYLVNDLEDLQADIDQYHPL